VQFSGEMSRDRDGRVSGRVSVAGDAPVPFSGWLELLRLLEDCTEDGGVDLLEGTDR
jgi:hypothetical protein